MRHTHIYIYILPSTDRLFRSIRTLQCGWKRRTLESKPVQLYDRLSLRPLGQQRTTLATGIFGILYFSTQQQQQQPLFTFFHTLSATRELNSFEEPCITLTVADNSFAREPNPMGSIYIYIYIYKHKIDYLT